MNGATRHNHPFGEPVLSVLDGAECRALLCSVPIGRLAFTIGALPTVEPMHFTLRGDELLIPARRGGKVAAATHGAVVAFEVDDYDVSTRTGWSVTVVGASRVLTDPVAHAALAGAGLRTWAAGENSCIISVPLTRIDGRRLRPSDAVSGEPH